MKVLVAIKRVVDSTIPINVKDDGSGIDEENIKASMNPFDEVAIEEACRLREQGIVSEIVAVSCGSIIVKDTLQVALAMGADRAILVESNEYLYPLSVAKLLKAIFEQEKPDLIFLGKQAIDDDANQVGQMLASLLDIGQATCVSKVSITKDNISEIFVNCEIDSGMEKIALSLPAVVTVDLRLNEPRYVTLPNIIKARKKILAITTASELNVDIKSGLKIIKFKNPPSRDACLILNDVFSLVDKLKNNEKVI